MLAINRQILQVVKKLQTYIEKGMKFMFVKLHTCTISQTSAEAGLSGLHTTP